MEYWAFLMNKLMEVHLVAVFIVWDKLTLLSNLEYDLQFEKSVEMYKVFKDSKYNDSNIDLYECLEAYIKEVLIANEWSNYKKSNWWDVGE